MSENDPIHAAQRSTPKRSKKPKMVDPAKQKRDEFIMDTNNSSIVSKRSVEKLYYAGEPQYFCHFTGKFKRRSPLINRGYWLRMRAIEHTVQKFLEESSGKKKVVINLGCGYDPLPWLFLGKIPEICNDAVFVDVDYPQLMQKKYAMINESDELKEVLPGLQKTGKDSGLMCHNEHYAAIGCDLRNLDFLKSVLQDHLNAGDSSVAILFVAEVSTAYMDVQGSQAVFEWAASYDDARFCLLEQHLPDGADHPFAQTMVKHFVKLRTPLHAIGTIDQMKNRFSSAGWPNAGLNIKPLWDLWSDPNFLSPEQRRALDKVEPFDEWEEFALFGSHYFLMVATKPAPLDNQDVRLDAAPDTESSSLTNIVATELPGDHSYRRFAAVLPSTSNAISARPAFPDLAKILGNSHRSGDSVGLHAGLGVKERITSTDIYTTHDPATELAGPNLPVGLMCHTISAVQSLDGSSNDDCLLVGGRTAPDRAFADCWLRRNGLWEKAISLPEGRYRHNALSVATSAGRLGVLVYGGKTSESRVLDDAVFWTKEMGWQRVQSEGPSPPARFGATLISDSSDCCGTLVGGMTDDGIILEDKWSWHLRDNLTMIWTQDESFETHSQRQFSRFGAQTTTLEQQDKPTVLVGGIIGKGMLTRLNEIVDFPGDFGHQYHLAGDRPMLTGHSLHGSLILGGGATCFSFGTYWSSSRHLQPQRPNATAQTNWHLAESGQFLLPVPASQPTLPQPPIARGIRRVTLTDSAPFTHVLEANQPLVLTNLNIGPCTQKWTPAYLTSTLGADRQIVIHSSPTPKMSFQTKNFAYKTVALKSFLDGVQKGEHLYLRSLSSSEPSRAPANLSTDFPEISPDFALPPELSLVSERAHSSPLRISGPVAMWLHYDVMANILFQVRGRKKLLLFPPKDVGKLGFPPGHTSSALDVFDATLERNPELEGCEPWVCELGPGEGLFVPPLWAHAAVPLGGEGRGEGDGRSETVKQSDTVEQSESLEDKDGKKALFEPSVAVNVFFRNLDSSKYAAGRDVYGNRDLAAYEKGRKDVGMIAKAFKGVPGEVRGFYLERLGAELVGLAKEGGGEEGKGEGK